MVHITTKFPKLSNQRLTKFLLHLSKVWIRDAKKNSPSLKIVPRIIFDHWSSQHFLKIFDNQNLADKLAFLIAKIVNDYNFDGLVLEVWSQLGGQAKLQTTQLVCQI